VRTQSKISAAVLPCIFIGCQDSRCVRESQDSSSPIQSDLARRRHSDMPGHLAGMPIQIGIGQKR
jgi:hypothetical protein